MATETVIQTKKRKKPKRQDYYPTPQNDIKLNRATINDDGSRKDGISKNALINRAVDAYFKLHGLDFGIAQVNQ